MKDYFLYSPCIFFGDVFFLTCRAVATGILHQQPDLQPTRNRGYRQGMERGAGLLRRFRRRQRQLQVRRCFVVFILWIENWAEGGVACCYVSLLTSDYLVTFSCVCSSVHLNSSSLLAVSAVQFNPSSLLAVSAVQFSSVQSKLTFGCVRNSVQFNPSSLLAVSAVQFSSIQAHFWLCPQFISFQSKLTFSCVRSSVQFNPSSRLAVSAIHFNPSSLLAVSAIQFSSIQAHF